jgi:hypothetical protein
LIPNDGGDGDDNDPENESKVCYGERNRESRLYLGRIKYIVVELEAKSDKERASYHGERHDLIYGKRNVVYRARDRTG